MSWRTPLSRYQKSVILMSSLLMLSSCAWYRDLERSLVEDDQKQNAGRKSKVVPREQYDELLVKYEEVSKKYEDLKSGKPTSSSLVDELQRSQTENFANGSNSVETVDVFGAGAAAAVAGPLPQIGNDLESQVSAYRKGLILEQNNPTEALKLFQMLDAKAAPSVQVRAKLHVGELLMKQNQYDLALQSFEDIIQKHAHSGVVIEALRNASICGDKLGLANKRDQYSSMLKDVFEMN